MSKPKFGERWRYYIGRYDLILEVIQENPIKWIILKSNIWEWRNGKIVEWEIDKELKSFFLLKNQQAYWTRVWN